MLVKRLIPILIRDYYDEAPSVHNPYWPTAKRVTVIGPDQATITAVGPRSLSIGGTGPRSTTIQTPVNA